MTDSTLREYGVPESLHLNVWASLSEGRIHQPRSTAAQWRCKGGDGGGNAGAFSTLPFPYRMPSGKNGVRPSVVRLENCSGDFCTKKSPPPWRGRVRVGGGSWPMPSRLRLHPFTYPPTPLPYVRSKWGRPHLFAPFVCHLFEIYAATKRSFSS